MPLFGARLLAVQSIAMWESVFSGEEIFSLLREKGGDETGLGMYPSTSTSCSAQGLLKSNLLQSERLFFLGELIFSLLW